MPLTEELKVAEGFPWAWGARGQEGPVLCWGDANPMPLPTSATSIINQDGPTQPLKQTEVGHMEIADQLKEALFARVLWCSVSSEEGSFDHASVKKGKEKLT